MLLPLFFILLPDIEMKQFQIRVKKKFDTLKQKKKESKIKQKIIKERMEVIDYTDPEDVLCEKCLGLYNSDKKLPKNCNKCKDWAFSFYIK